MLDGAALDRNLRKMQAFCDSAGVSLRAHGKMHKCSSLAKRQLSLGAVGICAQTVGEAQAFAAAGIADILITSPIAMRDVGRAVVLAKLCNVKVTADDPVLIASLAEAAKAEEVTLSIVVDIDLGQRRTGCPPDEAIILARQVADTDHLRFDGLQAYFGHLQHDADLGRREAENTAATQRLAMIVRELIKAGLAPSRVTGGGTGTYAYDIKGGVFTEIQAGSYAVMDAEYDACGAPDGKVWPFEPALFVATTVVSNRQANHATVDAGLKALSTDGPIARVMSGASEGSKYRFQGDEHGAILQPVEVPKLELGQTVWLQPGHCDPTINLYDAFLVWEADRWTRWPVDARRSIPPL